MLIRDSLKARRLGWLLTSVVAVNAFAQVGPPTKLATGQQITPVGDSFRLSTGLRPDGNADAAYAVTTALSPDGKTLLILTTGFNNGFYKEDGTPIVFPILDPVTGLPTSNTTSNCEWVFVYDVSGPTPVQLQKINIPITYVGLVWSPGGERFYVSGGVDNLIYVFKKDQTGAFVPDVPFVQMNTKPQLQGTPAGPGIADAGLLAYPAVAGLAVTHDGKRLYAANFENDSISEINTTTRQIIRELVFSSPGNARTVGEYPYWVAVERGPSGKDRVFVTSQRDGEVVYSDDFGEPKAIQTGSAPNKMILSKDGSRLFVADGNRDTVGIIDATNGVLTNTISLSRPGFHYKGANPNSVALSPDEQTLYVTLGGENAVAVVDLKKNKVAGRIPTGWYPSSVSVSADGTRLFVVNSKSVPGPNPENGGPNPTFKNAYVMALEKASLEVIPVPDATTLAAWSIQVDQNNGFLDHHNDPVIAALRTKIKHVIYIVKENRTYDQVLGDLTVGNGDPTLTMFPRPISPNHHKLAADFVTLDNFYVSGEGSGEGWDWSTEATINEYNAKATPANYGNGFSALDDWATNRNLVIAFPDIGSPPNQFTSRITGLLDPTGQSAILPGPKDIAAPEGDGDLSPGAVGGYLWDEVLRSHKTLRHYGFYTDYTYYFVNPPLYIPISRTPFSSNIPQGPPLKRALRDSNDIYYRGFDLSVPDRYHYEEWKREFDDYVRNRNLPDLQIMSLPLDHFGSFGSNVGGLNTPELEMADNDYALGKMVEAVSHSPYWKDTAFFVLEDDAQAGPDHVDAHRSPAFVISAYTKRRAVVSTYYTTVNMMRTIEDLIQVRPLTLFDANADPMSDVFTDKPDLTPYDAVLPGSLCKPPVSPDLIPECHSPSVAKTEAQTALHDGAWWSAATKGFDFRRPDAIDSAAFNRVLWRGIKGDIPYPEIRQKSTSAAGTDDDRR